MTGDPPAGIKATEAITVETEDVVNTAKEGQAFCPSEMVNVDSAAGTFILANITIRFPAPTPVGEIVTELPVPPVPVPPWTKPDTLYSHLIMMQRPTF